MSKTLVGRIVETSDAVTAEEIKLYEPKETPSSKDHVVGIASDGLKKSRVAFNKYFDDLIKKLKELEKLAKESCPHAEKKCKECKNEECKIPHAGKIAEIITLRQEYEVVQDVLWSNLRAEFNLWDKETVGIFKGWKVAWSEKNEVHAIAIRIGKKPPNMFN